MDGLIIDGANVSSDAVHIKGASGNEASYIRLNDCEVKNSVAKSINIDIDTNNIEVIECSVHDGAWGITVAGSDVTIEKSLSYNHGNVGILAFSTNDDNDNCVVQYCKVYDNTDDGISLLNQPGHKSLYNIVYGNAKGIEVDTGATGALLYQNTLYGNTTGIWVDNDMNASIKNNICYGNTAEYSVGTGNTDISNNFWSGLDPEFNNALGDDFTLATNSPAVNYGTDLGATYQNTLDPLSTWTANVLFIDQEEVGVWDAGAFAGNATYSLSGIVRSPQGAPMKVPVYVYAFPTENSGATMQIKSGAYERSTVSSAVDGSWSLTGLAFQKYVVVFEYFGSYGTLQRMANAKIMTAE
jgi:hypothetical protein